MKKYNYNNQDKLIEPTHTPTPFEVKDVIDHSYLNAHTDFIVRAVNSHEEMLNTLTWLSNEIDENGQGSLPDALVSAIRRALAKAEVGK